LSSPILPSTIVPPPPPPSCPAPPAARRRQPTPRSLPRARREIGEIVAANRRRWTDPAAPEPRAPGGSPPATNDRARRPSTSLPRPRGGWPRSLGGPTSVDRPAPSSERARRGESERRAVSSSARVPTAPGSIASIGHPREATGSDRISRRELADRDPPHATPPKRERTRRGGGEIRDRQATRTLAKRRQRRRLGQRTKERPACRSQSMPPIIVASHYRRSTIAQIRNNIGEVGGRGLGGDVRMIVAYSFITHRLLRGGVGAARRPTRPNPRRGTPPPQRTNTPPLHLLPVPLTFPSPGSDIG